MKILVALACALVLAGCGTDDAGTPAKSTVEDGLNGSVHEIEYPLSDGTKVTCLIYKSGYKGGISCDWNPNPVKRNR